MSLPPDELTEFAPQTAHKIVSDLMRPKMAIYWADLAASLTVGVVASASIPLIFGPSPWAVVAYLVSVVAFYRTFVFLHEIVHFRSRRQFTAFRRCWNVLVGVPMFVPIFMYECHSEHHNPRIYGTSRDPEYVPLARLAPSEIVKIVAGAPLIPFFGPIRFGILTPVSWFVPRLRSYVYEQLSALKLDLEYKGRQPSGRRERRVWLVQELGCFAVVWATVAGVALGFVPWLLVLQWYLTYAGIALLDSIRLLGAHRYLGDEDSMTLVEQMLDTYNYPRRRVITELWAPVGLRLHALHHLLPGLPYHAYQEAHQRLVERLPADSPYVTTESPGLFWSIRQLWTSSRREAQHP